MALSDVINTALERIQHIAKTETIFGDPVTIGDVTLIPVSKVSVGFAAGGAGKDDKGNGAGAGGGVNVTPVAFISISGDNIRVHHLEGSELVDLHQLLSLAPDTVKKVISFIKKKFKGKDGGDDEDADEAEVIGSEGTVKDE